MLLETECASVEELIERIDVYFQDANLPQKRLMLRMTNSQALQASWIKKLSTEQTLDLVRNQGLSGGMNFALLALCSD